MKEKCKRRKNVARVFLCLAMMLACSLLLSTQKASAKTNEEGVVINNGVIGNVKITTHRGADSSSLYVTNLKTKKKVKLAAGELGLGVAVANGNVYYALDGVLYENSGTEKKNAKKLDQEIKSNNDSGMNILACKAGYLYYCKAKDAQYKKLNVYRYQLATGKKSVCYTDTFSYEFNLDVYKNYQYAYCLPTEVGSGYILKGAKLTSAQNKKTAATKIAKNVYGHTYYKNNIYYAVVNQKAGKVTYYKTPLNGKKKKVIASLNYLKLAKKNQKNFESAFYGPVTMTSKKAKFKVYLSKGTSNKTYTYSIDFKSGKVVVEK